MMPFKERNQNHVSFQSFIKTFLAIGKRNIPALSLSPSLPHSSSLSIYHPIILSVILISISFPAKLDDDDA
jgi:hypothetical protein